MATLFVLKTFKADIWFIGLKIFIKNSVILQISYTAFLIFLCSYFIETTFFLKNLKMRKSPFYPKMSVDRIPKLRENQFSRSTNSIGRRKKR